MNCTVCTNTSTEVFLLEPTFLLRFNIGCAILHIICSPIIIVGNSFVILSIVVYSRLRNHANYLLFSLALSDLLVGLIICPLLAAIYLEENWLKYDRTVCLFRTGFVALTMGGSISSLFLIILDRFFAIVFPFAYIKLCSRQLALKVLAVVWIHVIVASLMTMLGRNNYVERELCRFAQVVPRVVFHYGHTTAVVYIVVSTVLYMKIFLVIRNHRRQIDCVVCAATSNKMSHNLQKCTKFTKVNVTVFFLFVFFWSPTLIVSPLFFTSLRVQFLDVLQNGSTVLLFANSLVNPVVYALKRKDFNMAFRLLLSTPLRRWSTLYFNKLDTSSTLTRHRSKLKSIARRQTVAPEPAAPELSAKEELLIAKSTERIRVASDFRLPWSGRATSLSPCRSREERPVGLRASKSLSALSEQTVDVHGWRITGTCFPLYGRRTAGFASPGSVSCTASQKTISISLENEV